MNRFERKEHFAITVSTLIPRFLCLLALIAFAITIANSVDLSLGSSRNNVASVSAESSLTDDVMLVQIQPGSWSFDGSPLLVQRRICDSSLVDQYMDKTGQELGSLSPVRSSEFDVSGLIKMVQALGASNETIGAVTRWHFVDDQVRVSMLVTDEKDPKFLHAALATRTNDRWELTTICGNSTTARTMLPFHDSAACKCARLDAAGEPVLQIVSTAEPISELKDRWKQSGWSLRETPWSTGDATSLICSKGSLSMYVWFSNREDQQSVMISRIDNHNVEDSR